MPRKSKEALSEYNREYNKRTGHGKSLSDKRREWLDSHKTPCVACGENNPVCIDFHHLDPSTKVMNVSKMATLRARSEVLLEINKCVCLCANCHRKFHAGQLVLPVGLM